MISRDRIAGYLADCPGAVANRPYDDPVTAYWLEAAGQTALFALLSDHPIPRLSLRCDPVLARRLRAEYETVSPAAKLNRKLWSTILLTGQLGWDEIIDLVDHSYRLALASASDGAAK